MKPTRFDQKLIKSPQEQRRATRRATEGMPQFLDTLPRLQHAASASSGKDSSNNIKVVARFRPKNDYEEQLEVHKVDICKYLNPASILIGEGKDQETVTFDRIFDPTASQVEVFEAVGRPVIDDVLAGYNGTVFAYGQTGSGKTFSMMGLDVFDEELRGIVPRAASGIFKQVNEAECEVEFILKCSMLEIYKETLRDLLGPEGGDLRIKEDPRKGIYVKGLTEVFVTSEEEMLEVIAIGEQMRTVGVTKCNAVSSRSHELFFMEVKQRFPNDSEKRGILNLVDLAGSEKITHSGVTGNNLQEAKKINLSLSALGNVIHALVTNSDHIPYRDSKLTRLLQESLGGNYKTTVLIALSPCSRHYDETINSIKFAQRVKHIKNRVSMNIKNSPEAYQIIIDKLTEELRRARAELQYTKGPKGLGNSLGRFASETTSRVSEDASGSDKVSTSELDSVANTDGFSQTRKHTTDFECQIEDFKQSTQKLVEQDEKIKTLEGEKLDLTEKVSELEQQVQSLKKKLLKEEKQAHEYYLLYHQATQLIKKEGDDSVLLKKQNEGLLEQVRRLTRALQDLDEKFCRVLEEIQQPNSSTIVEFDDKVDDPDPLSEDSDDDLTVNDESRIPSPTRPVRAHVQEETTQHYFNTVKVKLEPNSILNKEAQVQQLKNQLLQAHFVNCNLSRTVRAFGWKNSLLSHKFSMKNLFAKHLSRRIKGLEELIDHIQESYNSICALMEKVGGDTSKGSRPESPAPKSRVTRPLIRSGSFRKLLPGNKSGGQDHSGRDLSSLWNKSHSYLDPDQQDASLCSKLKNYETNLRLQQSYNLQLKEALQEIQEESEKTKIMAQEIERQIYKDHKDERQRWSQYIEEYRQATETELREKDVKIEKLNEVLCAWVERFTQLQEMLPEETGKHRRSQSTEYIEDLKRLCGWTYSIAQKEQKKGAIEELKKSPMWSMKPSAQKYSASTVTAGSGDQTPMLPEQD